MIKPKPRGWVGVNQAKRGKSVLGRESRTQESPATGDSRRVKESSLVSSPLRHRSRRVLTLLVTEEEKTLAVILAEGFFFFIT